MIRSTPHAPGSIHGCWQVIERLSPPTHCESSKTRYRCRCLKCGTEKSRTQHALASSRAEGGFACRSCFIPITKRQQPSNRCVKCEGLSWRRPSDGTPCKCGKLFAPERVKRPEIVHSNAGFC